MTSKKSDERNTSLSLKKKLESYEYILMLCLWKNILRTLNVVSKLLQGVNFSIKTASTLLDHSINQINKLRNSYDKIYIK